MQKVRYRDTFRIWVRFRLKVTVRLKVAYFDMFTCIYTWRGSRKLSPKFALFYVNTTAKCVKFLQLVALKIVPNRQVYTYRTFIGIFAV